MHGWNKEVYNKIPSEAGKNKLTWDTNNDSLDSFKHAAIAGVRRDDVAVFADHVALYDEMKQVTWHASIPTVATSQQRTRPTSTHLTNSLNFCPNATLLVRTNAWFLSSKMTLDLLPG
ncbi:hypothetical protein H4Q26_004294 [Puccinia striiformis f. sp. tritici PST-130]|nr:hypothetical protein H4Q26_004294 [Puccinia striiformis f. sp. tritici PST-130]